uniref:Paraneoplastic antigen Ma-like C-terminal domain-containing protein n=1 Tax=Haplochromis burtoni TaxID=8153 RepID=A0A3Q2VPU6_HAPBU
MDFVEKYAVKVPNAIIVSGVTDRDKDKEVFEFLERHGTIRRVLSVDDDSSAFYKSQIVEFESGAAVEILAPKLPYLLQSTDNPDVSYRIRALTDVYTKTVGGSVTEAYISNLKGLAKLSGKDFEEVLREALSTIGKTIEAAETAEINPENDAADQTCPVVGSTQLGASPSVLTELPHPAEPIQGAFQRPMRPNLTPQILSPTDLNPPEVQKVVVEHVVKSVEKTSHAHSTLRLRAFSGKMPRPYSEADYETWRSHVDLLMEDTSLSELERTRKILESLLSPASDVIRPLGPEATPADYLNLLDSAFGTVEDGEELFVRFMNTLQDHGEKPSAYLLRLQVAVNHTVRRGGLEPHEVNKQLLKQFYRGCWDDNLLTELQL